METPTDKELIHRYRAGDEAAIGSLIERHLKPVYNFVYRLAGHTQDSENITQEVFIKVWKNIRRYDPDQEFRTWLFTIARNTALDWLRKKKNLVFSDFENAEGKDTLTGTLADPLPLPDEVIARAADKKFLDDVLARIPPTHREVLVLRYNDHFTFREIGTILDRPLDTIKSQHRRALIALRKLLDAPKR